MGVFWRVLCALAAVGWTIMALALGAAWAGLVSVSALGLSPLAVACIASSGCALALWMLLSCLRSVR